METKVCTKCGVEKPTTKFHKDKRKTGGLHRYCAECNNRAARLWNQNNAERQKANRLAWEKDNPGKKQQTVRNRRARRHAAGGSHTFEDVKRIMRSQRGRCACCRSKLVAYHVDHIIPLKLKGSNNPDNIQILCPTCNLQKNAKHPIDFMQERGFLL